MAIHTFIVTPTRVIILKIPCHAITPGTRTGTGLLNALRNLLPSTLIEIKLCSNAKIGANVKAVEKRATNPYCSAKTVQRNILYTKLLKKAISTYFLIFINEKEPIQRRHSILFFPWWQVFYIVRLCSSPSIFNPTCNCSKNIN